MDKVQPALVEYSLGHPMLTSMPATSFSLRREMRNVNKSRNKQGIQQEQVRNSTLYKIYPTFQSNAPQRQLTSRSNMKIKYKAATGGGHREKTLPLLTGGLPWILLSFDKLGHHCAPPHTHTHYGDFAAKQPWVLLSPQG